MHGGGGGVPGAGSSAWQTNNSGTRRKTCKNFRHQPWNEIRHLCEPPLALTLHRNLEEGEKKDEVV